MRHITLLTLSTFLLMCTCLAAQLEKPDETLPYANEREYLEHLVRTGGDIVQRDIKGYTVVSTFENFTVTMPDGIVSERGVVSRVIAPDGEHVAELLMIREAQMVVWKIRSGEKGKEAAEVAGFPLDRVAAEHKSAAEPVKSLAWANDFLYHLWLTRDPSAPAEEMHHSDSKDNPGCCGLHWLDNSTLRRCCDDHDNCYATNSCTAASWNPANGSWECTGCNIAVIACFPLSYFLNGGIFWEWCWGLSCCDPPDYYPCIIIECT